jgi:hypothetical protein
MAVSKREIGALLQTCLENTFVQGSMGVPEVGETTVRGRSRSITLDLNNENAALNTTMRSCQWPCSEGQNPYDVVFK